MSAALDLHPTPGHPAAVVAAVHEALDGIEVEGLSPDQYATTIAELARARSRLHAVELALVAAAERSTVAADAGCSSTGAWLSRQTRSGGAAAARAVKLATDLHDRLPVTAGALSDGTLSPEHAAAIAHATSRLPARLTGDQLATVEASLVAKAQRVDPVQLRRLARRAMAAVEEDASLVDAHEDAQLRDEEAVARDRTRLTLHDNGDGTTSGHFTVPTLAASILRKALDAMTAPRRSRPGATRAQGGDTRVDRGWAHDRGLAFTDLLEHLPTDRLHSKVAATVVVTLGLDTLRGQLKTAGLDTGDLARPPRPAGSRARRDWSPPCSAARPSRSTSDAPAGCSPRRSGSPEPPATPAAPLMVARCRMPGASSTTDGPGAWAAGPTWPTWCRCAGSTTAGPTIPDTCTAGCRTDRSASRGGREPGRR
jgi:hypothetical protein